tara:strand:+ start:1050 stop:1940 length:891 start_codon:yes stop_codon:yes gene_type:complete
MQTITPTKFDTIEQYVQNQSDRAIKQSDLITHTKRQEALGFTGTELSKRTKELGTLFSEPELQAKYAKKYPGCVFLPWSALHMIRINLNIGLDIAENYRGAIPAPQLKAMELFDMEKAKEDSPKVGEFIERLASSIHLDFFKACAPILKASNQLIDGEISEADFNQVYINHSENLKEKLEAIRKTLKGSFDVILPLDSRKAIDVIQATFEKIKAEHASACNGFVVLAPFQSFTTGVVDLVERCKRIITQGAMNMGILKRDPLALKFVSGGALVVAAWGNEADELNRIAQEQFELNI